MSRRVLSGLHRYALLTAAATFLLLIAGGLVTSTDSGLAVPDWPLSYGTLFPPMVGGIVFEHSHRVIAGVVALLIAALAAWLWRGEPRRWVRRLGVAAVAMVLGQALLGGLTVLLVLPAPISIAHACLGQSVFCVVALLSLVTSPAWPRMAGCPDRWIRWSAASLATLLAGQLALGAMIRHSGVGIPFHIAGATLVCLVLVLLLWRLSRTPVHSVDLRPFAWLIAAGVALQIGLGAVVLLSGQHPAVTTAHVALGALLLAGAVLLTAVVWKPLPGQTVGFTSRAPSKLLKHSSLFGVGGSGLGAKPILDFRFSILDSSNASHASQSQLQNLKSKIHGPRTAGGIFPQVARVSSLELRPSIAVRWPARISDYAELAKPRLTALAVASAAVGFVMAARRPIDLAQLARTLLGAWLAGAGGNALNQWYERDADALMTRTRTRPLPSGRLRPSQALWFGLISAALGIGYLAVAVRPLSGLLALATVAAYVGVYTPLKRVTSLSTLVGAVPGALPPLIGYSATGRSFGVEAWVLFAIVFLWQLPHFLAIAWVHREDYARAGFAMLPVLEPDGGSTARQMVLYGLALLPISLLPTILHLAGAVYFVGAMAVGCWFLAVAIGAARARSHALASRLFLASVTYLPIVLGLLIIDRIPRP